MIWGIGCDIVNAERFRNNAEFMEHFIRRAFSENEKAEFQKRSFASAEKKVLYLAKRFAGKEAVVKALGTGFRDGIYLSDIEIFNNEMGKPEVVLSSKILEIKDNGTSMQNARVYLSLSDDYPYAQAMAVIEI